jgi:hypothetical protein
MSRETPAMCVEKGMVLFYLERQTLRNNKYITFFSATLGGKP